MANTRVTNPVTGFNSATEEGLKLPSGTNANQPSGVQGMIRNDTGETTGSSASAIEHHNGTNWQYFAATESPDNPFLASQNFNTVLYTGNGATQLITGVGFEPDLVWIKQRTGSVANHLLFDSIRGAYKQIMPNTTSSGVDRTSVDKGLTSFDSNGFTVKDTNAGDYEINGPNGGTYSGNGSYVAWCWKAGGAAVANTDGSIASQVSANIAGGFSIVKTTGTSGAITFGHGLDTAPEMIINKGITSSGWSWLVYHKDIGTGKYLKLNSTDGTTTNSASFSSVTSTTITNNSSNSSSDYINYCFASIPNYSKVGSFLGTGVAGKKITLDFEPSWILTKRTSTSGGGWYIIDNKRSTASIKSDYLQANSDAVEATSSSGITFDTDGFTFTGASFNTSGATHMYYAIA